MILRKIMPVTKRVSSRQRQQQSMQDSAAALGWGRISSLAMILTRGWMELGSGPEFVLGLGR